MTFFVFLATMFGVIFGVRGVQRLVVLWLWYRTAAELDVSLVFTSAYRWWNPIDWGRSLKLQVGGVALSVTAKQATLEGLDFPKQVSFHPNRLPVLGGLRILRKFVFFLSSSVGLLCWGLLIIAVMLVSIFTAMENKPIASFAMFVMGAFAGASYLGLRYFMRSNDRSPPLQLGRAEIESPKVGLAHVLKLRGKEVVAAATFTPALRQVFQRGTSYLSLHHTDDGRVRCFPGSGAFGLRPFMTSRERQEVVRLGMLAPIGQEVAERPEEVIYQSWDDEPDPVMRRYFLRILRAHSPNAEVTQQLLTKAAQDPDETVSNLARLYQRGCSETEGWLSTAQLETAEGQLSLNHIEGGALSTLEELDA